MIHISANELRTQKYLDDLKTGRKFVVDLSYIYRRPNFATYWDLRVDSLECNIYLVYPEYSLGIISYNYVHMYTENEILTKYNITKKELDTLRIEVVNSNPSARHEVFKHTFYKLFEAKDNDSVKNVTCPDTVAEYLRYKKYASMFNK